MTGDRVNWRVVITIAVGAAVWLELFLRYPLYSVVLLAVIGGWWDYMRPIQAETALSSPS